MPNTATRIVLSTALFTALSCQAHPLELNAMGGINISQLPNSRVVPVSALATNDYIVDKSTQIGPILGLGLAGRVHHADKISIKLGGTAYYVNYETVRGTELPFINAGVFDTLDYHFRARSYALMLEPKFIYTQFAWQPYAIAGMGVSWNRLYNYGEKPTNPSGSAAPVPRGFRNNTEAAFAYEIGAGIQHRIFDNPNNHCEYMLSLDYRYMNFGQGELGTEPSQTTHTQIDVSPLYTQAVLLSFTTIF